VRSFEQLVKPVSARSQSSIEICNRIEALAEPDPTGGPKLKTPIGSRVVEYR
jgi:hypothetical protein